jgi:hypothetical protein
MQMLIDTTKTRRFERGFLTAERRTVITRGVPFRGNSAIRIPQSAIPLLPSFPPIPHSAFRNPQFPKQSAIL